MKSVAYFIEQTMGPTESSVSVGVRQDQPCIGADFWWYRPLELRGEYAVIHGGERVKWSGQFDLSKRSRTSDRPGCER